MPLYANLRERLPRMDRADARTDILNLHQRQVHRVDVAREPLDALTGVEDIDIERATGPLHDDDHHALVVRHHRRRALLAIPCSEIASRCIATDGFVGGWFDHL